MKNVNYLNVDDFEGVKNVTNDRVDFYRLGSELWSIANIFRDDTLKTTEYLEEFSYFLFLKMFDDREMQKEEIAELDGEKYIPYLPEDLRFYNWAGKIVNDEISTSEILPTVKNIFQQLVNIKDHDGKDLSLFRRLFKNHIWRIRYVSTIRDLLKRLTDLELEQNFDVLGRAYEFIVQKLGEQKQYGQYFTPRHIIHFMVELADLEIEETIYDPAAGTGGFILRSFEVIKCKIEKLTETSFMGLRESTVSYGGVESDRAEKLLRDLKGKCLFAVEKAPDVYKLALMNMILHNDGNTNLCEADSLDNRAQVEHREKYDVVLTNPPYGPLTQSRVGTFDYHVKRFEALFIQHVMNALKFSHADKKPSRAVIIVLDKILFDNTKAFKNIRKKLLREYNLKAVFSMPAGIFQPYSGAKTSILYFEKPTKEQWGEVKRNQGYMTKNVLFFDAKGDGFTLSTQRRPINGAFQGDEPDIYDPPCGDLPKAVEVFGKWVKWLETPTNDLPDFVDNEQVWVADIEEIKEKDFNLNPGLYRTVERENAKWDWETLGNLIEITFGQRITKKKHEGTLYPVYGGGGISFYTDNYNSENEIVVSRFGMSEECVRFAKDKFWLLDSGFTIKSKDKSLLDNRFVYYTLKYIEYEVYNCGRGAGQKNINMDCFENLEIPLPPLEIQKQLVGRLDKQQTIIRKAKAMEKSMLEAGIDNAIFEGDWDWTELEKVITFAQYGLSTKADGTEEDTPILGMNNITYNGQIDVETLKYIKLDEKTLKKYELCKGDILFNRTNSKELVGKTAVFELEDTCVFASYLIRLKTDSQKTLPEFVAYYMNSIFVKNHLQSLCRAIVGQANINLQELKKIKIPLPPLEKQKEIVAFSDVQFETLEKIRKSKKNAEEMIKLILEKEVFRDG